jgi:hypothetical protein
MTDAKYVDDLFFIGPLLHRVFRNVDMVTAENNLSNKKNYSVIDKI